MGAGTLWQCQASGCARGWRCTVRSLLCRPRLASSLSAPAAGKASELRLPQLGAGGSRNGSVKLPDARRGAIFLWSFQPGHLTQDGVCTSGPPWVCAMDSGY